MTPPVDLNAQKWLRLTDLAFRALARPDQLADELVIAAGRLTTVTPPHHTMAETAAATAFRWACPAYGKAAPADRAGLAPAVEALARAVQAIVAPGAPPPAAMAMPLPTPEVPAWTRRADIGGA